SFTFAASANPIIYQQAIPWFLDSEPRTWNLDPNALEDALKALARSGRRAKALIAVHLYGMPAEIHAIHGLCEQYGVPWIEDAAESLGSTIRDDTCNPSMRQTGSLGFAGVFSFNGNKIITTAGGGMVVARSAKDAALIRKWSTQSREPAAHYEHTELGYNYRMSNLLAALGTSQLSQLPAKIRRRRRIYEHYHRMLSSFPGIEFQPEPDGCESNRWLSAIRLHSAVWGPIRNPLLAHLAELGIESRALWKPMHLQPLFRGARHFGGTLSQALFEEGLCLPSGTALSGTELEEISGTIADFLQTRHTRN
ncbi:MAG: DegT/DnrJ/EryC1/StrS family aminotransferase, partial [Bryobacterales bacterium]|nr:DegT/DnrJ/EryC1/StrS family aminotransferase [Bryobacterales bacterium]